MAEYNYDYHATKPYTPGPEDSALDIAQILTTTALMIAPEHREELSQCDEIIVHVIVEAKGAPD